MITLLIEYRKPGNSAWIPCGIVGHADNSRSDTLIDFIKEEEPRLKDCEVSVRRFQRMPGVYTEKGKGLLVIMDDQISLEEPVLVGDTPAKKKGNQST